MDPSLSEANQKIQAAIEHLKRELATIRAGRANPSLIENIPVDAYGSRMKLMEVGTISAPQPSLLTVQVWDVSLTNAVVKAIMESSLGINPANDGQLIRLPIPPLTEERRKELTRVVAQKLEENKVEIRQIRHEIRKGWEKIKDLGEISEDELQRREKLLQDLIEKITIEVEELGKKKESELMEI